MGKVDVADSPFEADRRAVWFGESYLFEEVEDAAAAVDGRWFEGAFFAGCCGFDVDQDRADEAVRGDRRCEFL